MKPSDILLIVPPLCDTFGRTEGEIAAALIVRACQVSGDQCRPFVELIEKAIEADAPNFMTAQIDHKGLSWECTVRRPEGKTPTIVLGELRAEVDRLRPFEVALRELVESIDAEHRTFESTQRNDPARTAAVAESDRALVAARALLERTVGR